MKESTAEASPSVENIIAETIADELGVARNEITADASLRDDLGADSLDTIEITMEIEEQFQCCIDDEEAEKLLTIGDITHYIETLVKGGNAIIPTMR